VPRRGRADRQAVALVAVAELPGLAVALVADRPAGATVEVKKDFPGDRWKCEIDFRGVSWYGLCGLDGLGRTYRDFTRRRVPPVSPIWPARECPQALPSWFFMYFVAFFEHPLTNSF